MKERDALRKLFRESPYITGLMQKMVDNGAISADKPPEDVELMVLAATMPAGVDGEKQVGCGVCGGSAWIAPSTQNMLAKRKGQTTIICLDCFITQSEGSNTHGRSV